MMKLFLVVVAVSGWLISAFLFVTNLFLLFVLGNVQAEADKNNNPFLDG